MIRLLLLVWLLGASLSGAVLAQTTKKSTKKPSITTRSRSSSARTSRPASAAPAYDRIYRKDRTVVRGYVLETTTQDVVYRDLKGTIHRMPRTQVSRIEVSLRKQGSVPPVKTEAATAAKPAATKPAPATANASSASESNQNRSSEASSESAPSAFNRGDKFVELSLVLDGSRTKASGANVSGDAVSQLTLSPVLRYGTFIRDKTSIGVGVQYTAYKEPDSKALQRRHGRVMPFFFARRYLPMSPNIALYGEGQFAVGYEWNNFAPVNTDQRIKQTILSPAVRVAGGGTVRLGGKWWLNGQVNVLGITYYRRSYGPNTDANANLELFGQNTSSLFTFSILRFL